jgi:uncharacterized iron-regulated protein
MPRSFTLRTTVTLLLAVALQLLPTEPLLSQSASYVPHRVTRGKSFSDFEALLRDVASADVVYLGENHDDPGTHALQLAVLEGLARRGVPVVLALEMFERDVQAHLEAYLAGTMPESAFLAVSRPWENYASDYRPLVEFAKAQRWPVIATNIPRPLASAVSRGGLAVFDTLDTTTRGWTAVENQCGTDTKYGRKFTALMGGGGHGGGGMPAAAMDRFYAAQCVKDEAMAESIARALDAHPQAVIVHAAGGFHVEEGLGTVERVARRVKAGGVQRPVRRQVVVMFRPVPDLDVVTAGEHRRLGDYVVYVFRPRADSAPTDASAAAAHASVEPHAPALEGVPDETRAVAVVDQPSRERTVRPEQLMPRLHALAHDSMEGRGAGTPGGARGRAYLEAEARAIGLQPIGAGFQVPVRVRARPGADSIGANVIARLPGRRAGGPVLVLSAHHDHLGVRGDSIYNGADDDASGSVALLALAERFVAEPLEHDVIFAWFEAEESGMLGSRAFVAEPPVPLDRIAVNVNLDMVSRHEGGATLWVAGTAHYPFLRPHAEAVVPRAAVPIRFGHDTPGGRPSDNWTGSSDHASFHRAQIPFLYLGVEDHPDYHRPGDDAEKVDPAFYAATVSYAEALVRELDRHLEAIHAQRAR